jgi:hypothetical protein
MYHQSHYPWLINVQSGQDQDRSTINILSIRILTDSINLTYLYEILKSEQKEGREGEAIKNRESD